MTRKEIIFENGKLETQLDRHPELEDKINIQIRQLGKKLEATEKPPKHAKKRKYSSVPFTQEELEKLTKRYTNMEIAEFYGVDPNYVATYKKKWHIKGGNKAKPGRKKVV